MRYSAMRSLRPMQPGFWLGRGPFVDTTYTGQGPMGIPVGTPDSDDKRASSLVPNIFLEGLPDKHAWPPYLNVVEFRLLHLDLQFRESIRNVAAIWRMPFIPYFDLRRYTDILANSSRHIVPEALRAEAPTDDVTAWQGIVPMDI